MKKSIIAAALFLAVSACVPAMAHGSLSSSKKAQSNAAASAETAVQTAQAETAQDQTDTAALSRGDSAESAPVYGELLKWKEVNSLIPRGTTFKVRDLYTGKTFSITRTYGTNHIDGEAVSLADSEVIKSIWGGFNWDRRPVVITFNGTSIAASMSAMPHAGLDSQPADATVSNRSDGYGTGTNLDAVKDNGMDGVVDIHFLGSTRHLDGQPDPRHQAAIQTAAGN